MNGPKRSLPTLEDVAQRAGVSTATVSRCLNEPAKVSEATRSKVMAAVEALKYTPNFGARAIAANRTGIIGAIIPTMENSIFARGIEAFQKSLVAVNATMIVASSAYDPDQEAKLIRTMVGRGADGLLLIGTDRDPDTYAYLNERNIPYVIAWACSPDPTQSYVGFDNHAASTKLVAHAIAQGHRSIAYISAKIATNDRARERVLGALRAIKDAGLNPEIMHLSQTDYSVDNGRSTATNILQTTPETTLIICGNDVLAVGAIQAAQSLGRKIPDDLSIVGFDDIELATVIHPALTTVHVPHSDMGRIAAEALLTLTKTPQPPIRIRLKTRTMERGSLGPPPTA